MLSRTVSRWTHSILKHHCSSNGPHGRYCNKSSGSSFSVVKKHLISRYLACKFRRNAHTKIHISHSEHLSVDFMTTEWVNMRTTVRGKKGKRISIQQQEAGIYLQAIMQIVTHVEPFSHQHPPNVAINSLLQNFLRGFWKFQSPDFSNRSNLCSMIKGRGVELVAEDRIIAWANDQWAQEIVLCDLRKQLYSFGFH